jgi:hypothetical protein
LLAPGVRHSLPDQQDGIGGPLMAVLRWGRLNSLIDSASEAQNGQVAAWESASLSWKPTTITGGGPHTHPESDVVNLVTDLAGKADTGHTHSAYQALSEKAQVNGYASLGSDGKVPSAQLPAGAPGSAVYGKTVLDFGAFPGTSDASIAVTGQSGITAASIVMAGLRPEATPDHTADEHLIETLRVFAGNIIAGVGFTIFGVNDSQQHEPLISGGSGRAAIATVGAQSDDGSPRIGGKGTRIWGRWTVAWVWA